VSWRELAKCRNEDPELFFPTGTSGPALGQIAKAKAVCVSCHGRAECLRWAVSNGADDGVWGGKSEYERRAIKRRGAIQPKSSRPRTLSSEEADDATRCNYGGRS
jgi:WhiB family redox-sensing transcriptional regulator